MPVSRQRLPQERHRVFTGASLDITAAASWIESIASELGLPEPQMFAMQVCTEELMSNIVRHGDASSTSWPRIDAGKNLCISITVKALDDRITMTVEDNARAFNVVQAPAKAIDQALEKVQPGGLGIHLIKSFATNLRYSRTDTGNQVVVEIMG